MVIDVIGQLRLCPHISVFIWKRNFFFMDTASVHTYPKKTINENGTFENALQSTCGQTKTELFENAEDTLSVPIHSAEY